MVGPISQVNNRMIFEGGRVKMLDGSSVAKYLRALGYKDGDHINIVRHDAMLETVSMVGIPLAS